jgi:uncharacterized membrane protein YdjX (TVP38/TMEM64 family)
VSVDPAIKSDRGGRSAALAAAATLAGFVLIGVAALLLPFDVGVTLTAWLDRAGNGPWAAPAAILAFVVLASLGAPQFVLITALVAAFGPWAGFVYSWIAKVLSCALGFAVGRRFGARLIERRAGPNVTRVMEGLARHGFWASFLIRLAPTVPSVVINIAAGCSPMRFRDFIAGTALGSVPKMALVAFAGYSAISGIAGAGVYSWISLAGALAMMVVVGLIGRRWMKDLFSKGSSE